MNNLTQKILPCVCLALGTALLAGCGGSQTPSGNFSLGGGTGGTGTGGTVLSPFALTATARSASNALVWTTPTATGATIVTYDVYRAAGTSGALALLTTGLGGNQYTDTTGQVGTTYNYQVTAHDAGQTINSNTDSATVGGPATVGVGDPATNAPPGSPLFTAANFQYVTQSSGSRLSVDLTLSHPASVSDLDTIEIGGTVYIPTTGVTVSSNHLQIDSLAAGISLPPLQAGQLVSITVTVANTTNPIVPNAGRLELTGRTPAAGQTETDGPSGFQITLQNTP